MAPLAVSDLRRRYPDLLIDLDVLKIEDVIDFLLLGRGEVAAVSTRIEHPAITSEPLARGELFCIVAEAHPLGGANPDSAAEIASFPLIGIEPRDPYGRIVTGFSNAQASLSGADQGALRRYSIGAGAPEPRHRG